MQARSSCSLVGSIHQTHVAHRPRNARPGKAEAAKYYFELKLGPLGIVRDIRVGPTCHEAIKACMSEPTGGAHAIAAAHCEAYEQQVGKYQGNVHPFVLTNDELPKGWPPDGRPAQLLKLIPGSAAYSVFDFTKAFCEIATHSDGKNLAFNTRTRELEYTCTLSEFGSSQPLLVWMTSYTSAKALKSTSAPAECASALTEKALQVPLHRWEYVDDFGKTQGPYDALRIVKWIQSGFFDKRGGTLFRMAGEETSKTLLEQLPSIMTEAYAAMVLRMEKPQRMQAPPEETLEVVEMMPMNLSDQNSDIQSVLNVKAASESRDLRPHGGADAFHKTRGYACESQWGLLRGSAEESSCRSQIPASTGSQHRQLCVFMCEAWPVPQKMFKIPVHSAILRLSSPIWLTEITALEEKHKQRLLYSDHPDRQEMLKYIIECQNPEALRCIINYIYGWA
ncbi:uncharacterized protein LOC113147367 [Cyclospora cayetanensis]|uniref:Uncharacterized protein LOC113147367 n=1 Tax=Cyclospora cayetanensis TaxID=88456 RepID=A0A6P6S0Y0_9EIME|nr:uncharacterized protein LOC113147367 [Cyclospora cayetanensis]